MDGVTLRTVSNTEQPDDTWRVFTVNYNCTNAGNHTLAFVGTRAGGDYASAIDDVRIEAPATTAFQVTFTPSGPGLRTASITFTNNDADENPFTFSVQGTGWAPAAPTITSGGVTALGNGAFQFSFSNAANLPFSVLASTNIALPQTNWTVVGTATNAGGGLYIFTDPGATNQPRQFYRLRYP
jgi:hypothetical protein